MMSRLYRAMVIVVILVLWISCNKKDLNILGDIADDHAERLARLEKVIIEGQKMLASIHTLLIEYDKRSTITGTEVDADGGYTIRFSDGDSAVINAGLTPLFEIAEDGTWIVNRNYTGIPAIGEDGQDAVAPQVRVTDGIWEILPGGSNTWVSTGVTVKGDSGKGGIAPSISIGQNGNWFINGADTGKRAIGHNGSVITDAPQIEARDNGDGSFNWWIKNSGEEWVNTGILAMGKDGITGSSGKTPYVNNVTVSGNEVTFVFTDMIPGREPQTDRLTVTRVLPMTIEIKEDGVWVSHLVKPLSVGIGRQLETDFRVSKNTGKKVVYSLASIPGGFAVRVDLEKETLTVAALSGISGFREGAIVLRFENDLGETCFYSVPVQTRVDRLETAGLNFQNYFIYNVYEFSGREKVAEVCKEYLDNGTPEGLRAVVIYPFDLATLKRGKGMVAQYGGTVDPLTSRYNPADPDYPAGRSYADMLSGGKLFLTDKSGYFSYRMEERCFVPDTVADADGNTYSVAKIGTQYWMAENLRTTRYASGEAIPELKTDAEWQNSGSGGFCPYNNDRSKGILYNMSAVASDRLAPVGWRVPYDEDWKMLERYVGMTENESDGQMWRGGVAGQRLKSEQGWAAGGSGSNRSGFNALPAGIRLGGSWGADNAEAGFWWSSTSSTGGMWIRSLNNDKKGVYRGEGRKEGYSVRCIRER